MDDDDEIHSHSHPSPVSGSPPSSPRTNNRISVTVAAPAPLPAVNSLALALPIQQPARGNSGGGREDCWSEAATAVLVEAWGERYLELSRGNLKQKHWKEVAEIVNTREDYMKTPKTDIQCKNRIDTVKKKYKSEKAKIAASGGTVTSKWPFYDRLEQLIGPTGKIPGVSGTTTAGNSNSPFPVGIPVGIRTGASNYHPQKQQLNQIQSKNQKVQFRRRDPDSDSSEREPSPVSSDSFPPEGGYVRKRARTMNPKTVTVKAKEEGRKRKLGYGSALRELTQAILKFGEAYEQAETSKLQQVIEMEKQRMKFSKDLELQRMQFFMKTQMEISQLKFGSKNGNPSNHHSNNNNNINNNNNHVSNSDSE